MPAPLPSPPQVRYSRREGWTATDPSGQVVARWPTTLIMAQAAAAAKSSLAALAQREQALLDGLRAVKSELAAIRERLTEAGVPRSHRGEPLSQLQRIEWLVQRLEHEV